MVEFEDPRTRPRAAGGHLFAERKHMAKLFFQLDARNKCAFAALAVGDTQMAQRLERLASGHAADAQALGNHGLGRDRLARLEPARANVSEEVLLNLVVKRNNALPVKVEQVHYSPQLSRQLGVCI